MQRGIISDESLKYDLGCLRYFACSFETASFSSIGTALDFCRQLFIYVQ